MKRRDFLKLASTFPVLSYLPSLESSITPKDISSEYSIRLLDKKGRQITHNLPVIIHKDGDKYKWTYEKQINKHTKLSIFSLILYCNMTPIGNIYINNGRELTLESGDSIRLDGNIY